jgi:hypothetical protein
LIDEERMLDEWNAVVDGREGGMMCRINRFLFRILPPWPLFSTLRLRLLCD